MKSKKEIEALALELYPKMTDYMQNFINAAREEAFIKGYEMAQPKWISVKDRLPKFNGNDDVVDVIVYGRGCNWRKLSYIKNDEDDSGKFYFDFLRRFEDFTDVVTHWMPLPKPPTK